MNHDPIENDHGMPHDPFKSCVVPRPIAWLSTLSVDGVPSLVPYGQFQNLSFAPPYALRDAVNRSAEEVLIGVDESSLANVTPAPSVCVEAPRVAESPVQFECVAHHTLRLPGNGPMGTVDAVIGRVVRVHIKEGFVGSDGRLDVMRIRPLARLGYYDYTTLDSDFEMVIPGGNEDLRSGLEGRGGSS